MFKNIAILMATDALGDSLLTVPTLGMLRKAYPDAQIKLFSNCHSGNPILKAAGYVDETYIGISPAIGFIEPFDTVEEHWKAIGEPDLVIVYQEHERERSYIEGMPCSYVIIGGGSDDYPHQAQILAQFVSEDLNLPIPDVFSEEWVLDFRNKKITLPHKYSYIHIGAGSHYKVWPLNYYGELIDKLQSMGHEVVVIEGGYEIGSSQLIGWKGPIIQNIDAVDVALLIQNSRLFVGVDSGLSHLASMTGANSVVIFGPTNPILWRPIGPNTKLVYNCPSTNNGPDTWLLEDSGRISTQQCFDKDCLKSVTPNLVLDVIQEFDKSPITKLYTSRDILTV